MIKRYTNLRILYFTFSLYLAPHRCSGAVHQTVRPSLWSHVIKSASRVRNLFDTQLSLQVSLLSYNKLLLLHDLLSWPMSHHCVWGGLTPEKRDTVLPPLRACAQSSTYNWHLSLFWVSVTYTLTRCSITVSRVSATFYYHFRPTFKLVRLLKVTFVSRITARGLQKNIVGQAMCLHLVRGRKFVDTHLSLYHS